MNGFEKLRQDVAFDAGETSGTRIEKNMCRGWLGVSNGAGYAIRERNTGFEKRLNFRLRVYTWTAIKGDSEWWHPQMICNSGAHYWIAIKRCFNLIKIHDVCVQTVQLIACHC
ncbi:hypothetical protein Tcan_14780 [Toxocara canis]|uniref:Uncharacterized protein n=1 Tax=Toxocara canis TaxID=6265 RepID=A0A0B2UW66_TOXCA|nr:hypothetical protein Tcan_14780 [Toxocara canis]